VCVIQLEIEPRARPDCGLKARGCAETLASLENTLAPRAVRESRGDSFVSNWAPTTWKAVARYGHGIDFHATCSYCRPVPKRWRGLSTAKIGVGEIVASLTVATMLLLA